MTGGTGGSSGSSGGSGSSGAVGSLGPVLCVGVHILDVLGRPVSDIPPGQASVLLEEIRATAAGTAAGTAVDLAKLGVSVASFGAVGDDALGRLLLGLMADHGVDTSLVARKAGVPTSATMLPIRPNGERPALHAPGADRRLEAGDVSGSVLAVAASAGVLHIGGPDALGGFAGGPLVDLAGEAASHGATITLDVLGAGTPRLLERLAPLLSLTDWFLPNEAQLLGLTAEDGLAQAIDRLHQLGVRGVAVTRGADGCVIDDGSSRLELPALAVPVVDTTGCGDAFDAGFVVGLLSGCGREECGWLASACGALVATGLGSDAGLESREQVLELLDGVVPGVAASIRSRLAGVAAVAAVAGVAGVAGAAVAAAPLSQPRLSPPPAGPLPSAALASAPRPSPSVEGANT